MLGLLSTPGSIPDKAWGGGGGGGVIAAAVQKKKSCKIGGTLLRIFPTCDNLFLTFFC